MKDKCKKYRELIPLYAGHNLDKRVSHRVQKHLAKCPDCSALLDAQLESMDGGGRLYILGTASENAPKSSRKRKGIWLSSIAVLCVLLIITAVYLRRAGFVRIASVTVDELSAEYIQTEYPELLISESDVAMAENISYQHDHSVFHPDYEGEVLKEVYDNDKDLYTAFNYDDSHLYVYYMTSFSTIRLSWEMGVTPTAENMSKSLYSRFKIFDIIKETRYINHGNTAFEKYTATLDLWGTLTRQEFVEYGSGWT